MSWIANAILTLPAAAVLTCVFALPALEASAFVGFVFPGEIAVVLGGVVAFHGGVPLWAVIVCGIAGAVLGDSVGYEVGRRFGDRILARVPPRLLRPTHVAAAKALLRRLGGKAVFVGRFTAALRVLVPGLCGMARVPYRTFLTFNVAGGVTWVAAYAVAGYLAGDAWQRLQHQLSVASYLLVAALAVILVIALLVRRRRRRVLPAALARAEVEPVDDEAGVV